VAVDNSFLRVFKNEYDDTQKALAPKVFDPGWSRS
jgi:aspartyl/asparaginyl beta-hydroxylase (cupin superfamily)